MNFFRLAPLFSCAALAFAPSDSLFAEEQRAQASRQPPIGAENARKLDLNTADEKALAGVSVIGPDLARALVAARPFATIDDLERVQGVSTERLEQIRAQVTVVPVATKGSERSKDSMGLPRPTTTSTTTSAGSPRNSRAATATGTRGAGLAKVDVNSADQATLAALPSVGPDLAAALIAARPFKTMDDLARVQGVSSERLELLRQDLDVQPATKKAKRAKKSDSPAPHDTSRATTSPAAPR